MGKIYFHCTALVSVADILLLLLLRPALEVCEGENILTAGTGVITGALMGDHTGVHGGRVQIVVVDVPEVDEGGVGGLEDRDRLVGVDTDGLACPGAPHDVVVKDEGEFRVGLVTHGEEESGDVEGGGGHQRLLVLLGIKAGDHGRHLRLGGFCLGEGGHAGQLGDGHGGEGGQGRQPGHRRLLERLLSTVDDWL